MSGNEITGMVREAITSKKFVAALGSAITAAALKIGLDLPTEDVVLVLSPIVAYIVGQGWADRGKEAAKIQGTVDLVEANIEPPRVVKDKLV